MIKNPANARKPLIDWNHHEIIDMLCDLAFFAHERTVDETLLNQDFMLIRLKKSDLIPEQTKKANALEEAAGFFLEECDRLIGLLAFRGGHYVFVHRTFQEYLAAHYLSLQKEADQEKQLLVMLENSSHWREVIRLFFNRLGKKNPGFGEDLAMLVTKQAIEQQNNKLIQLAAECLNDFEEYRRRYALHDNIKIEIAKLRDRSHSRTELFVACGDALGLMNEPDIDVADPPKEEIVPEQLFKMGGVEESEWDDEKPIHDVRLSPFRIAVYPVTNKQFGEFVKDGGYQDKKFWCGDGYYFHFDGIDFLEQLKEKQPEYWLDNRFGKHRPLAPVTGVSWYEAMAYCRWWNLTFNEVQTQDNGPIKGIMRLPTEAEWEYACRAGSPTPFYTGDNLTRDQANYYGDYLSKTTTIGSFPPNKWGLYDMHGNVRELCQDWFGDKYYAECKEMGVVENPIGPESGSYRVLRGGSWYDDAEFCRSAYRISYSPGGRNSRVGFRLVFVPQSVGS